MGEFLGSRARLYFLLLWFLILTPHPDLSVPEAEVIPQSTLDLVSLVWGNSWGKRRAGPPGFEL